MEISLGTCVFKKLLKDNIINETQYETAIEELKKIYSNINKLSKKN